MPIQDMDSDGEDDTRSFTSARSAVESDHPAATSDKKDDIDARYSAEEEASLLQQSNELKASANTLFAKGAFDEAIPIYSRALAACPGYLDYELGVLYSNTAACHIKLSQWDEATSTATQCLDVLERLDPMPTDTPAADQPGKSADSAVKEVDDETEACMARLQRSGHTLDQVVKLRSKAMLRRAKARVQLGTWASLQGADEDYKYLLTQPLSHIDAQTVKTEMTALKPRLDRARETEMAEMMGKLKGLGNSILKPFGLSTDNFNFVKDPSTGNYSVDFSQGGGGR